MLAITFIFLHTLHLKFTINTNVIYVPVETTFSMSILCPNHNGHWSVFLTDGLLLHLLCPDLSDASSLTERTSDNQRLGTSNNRTSIARHPTLKSQLE